MAMQDVYDFFFDVNSHLTGKGLQRLDDMLRPAIMSGLFSGLIGDANLSNADPSQCHGYIPRDARLVRQRIPWKGRILRPYPGRWT